MKQFTPTSEQISLAEAVMATTAHESLIRPIVEGYEHAILKKHQFRISPYWVEKGVSDNVILDRKDSFLLSEEDSRTYFAECHAARDAAKLKVSNPEFCPLLVAEHLRIGAENALLKAMAATPGLESFGSGGLTLEIRDKAIDITLKLLAPFCRDADAILGGREPGRARSVS